MSKHKRYPMRIPKAANGIRLQESPMQARSWWARRWQSVLEGMGAGNRLGRGRGYAKSGQVLDIEIVANRVTMSVLGARPDPYEVNLVFRIPEGRCRAAIVKEIRSQPMWVARLLVNELPTELEGVFASQGFDLFPGGRLGPGRYDMTVSCTCPDYANPCKHVMAAIAILGEEVARRPATLLELRGFSMEEFYD